MNVAESYLVTGAAAGTRVAPGRAVATAGQTAPRVVGAVGLGA
ncbi:hypothetical protein [Seinonella peptonophila]|nr:hypothetical protein [Seinonella peptonophila]